MEKLIPSKDIVISGFLFCLVLFPLGLESRVSSQSRNVYDEIIHAVALKHAVDVSLIQSIIRAESNYNSRAISSKGAVGLMQLMPETAKKYGVDDLFDVRENIEGGVRYLKDLIKAYDGKADLVLAAYNAGQEAIKKYGGIPPYPETKEYIGRVRASGYMKKTITRKTEIYKYYDRTGRVVLTNDRNLYLLHKKDR